jgi:hypothetical protein
MPLAAELQAQRTMDGAAIDSCIARAVAVEGVAVERANRDNWKKRVAALLVSLESVTGRTTISK